MDNSNEPEILNLFPPPPEYYKLFVDKENPPFVPPKITTHDVLDAQVFGGLYSKFQVYPCNDESSDSPKDFKSEFKRLTEAIFNESMELTTQLCSQHSASETKLKLDTHISDIHTLIHEYRRHEARENLCIEMRKQLTDIQALESSLEMLVCKNEKFGGHELKSLVTSL